MIIVFLIDLMFQILCTAIFNDQIKFNGEKQHSNISNLQTYSAYVSSGSRGMNYYICIFLLMIKLDIFRNKFRYKLEIRYISITKLFKEQNILIIGSNENKNEAK